MRCLLVVLALTSTASAEERRFGVGASVLRVPNVGVSLVTGISEHHALHFRAARYRPLEGFDAPDRVGRIYGASASWVVFSNRVLDGLSFEAGAFVRDISRLGWSDDATRRAGESIGVHALLGLTIPFGEHLYMGCAFGVSKSIEGGRDTDGETMKPFVETPLRLDGYFRIGWAFDA